MLPNLFLLYGDEDYLLDEELKSLRVSVASDFNYTLIESKPDSVAEIIQVLQTPAIWGGLQVIVIKNFDQLNSEAIPDLILILENLSPETKVVFCKLGSIDKRTKLFKFISRHGVVKEFKPLAEWEQDKVENFINLRVRQAGKEIDHSALVLFAALEGTNLRLISSEIEKLITYVGDRGLILEEDVKLLASESAGNVFSLLGAIRSRNESEAVTALHKLLREGEKPVPLLALIITQFRLLFQMKSLKEEGSDFQAIVRRLKLNPYFARLSFENLKNFKLDFLRAALGRLQETDLLLKTTQESPRLVLELLISDLIEHG